MTTTIPALSIASDQADAVCTTQKAAEILGISVSSVQQLVEAGVLEAWKTRGGHRRIPLRAVLAYKAAPAAQLPVREQATAQTGIMIIEDNPMQRAIYQRQLGDWQLPASLVFCDSGYQALLEIARRPPDILLADIVMEGIDGYEVVKTILADPQLAHMSIAIVSGLAPNDLERRGGVPNGVVYFGKPINYDELRGYLRASCAQLVRRHK